MFNFPFREGGNKSGRAKMQAAANKNLIFTGCSSKAEFTDSKFLVNSVQQIIAGRLTQAFHTREAYLNLTNELIDFAEQAYSQRNPDALDQICGVLMNLPIKSAQQVGLYYHALAVNRRGQRDEAEKLLKVVVDDAPITYRARAIQTLGTNLHDKGQLNEALRFQLEALRAASDKQAEGLQTTLLARLEIATIKSLNEDHKGALALLESIWPLVQIVSRQNPLYFYFYQNELAVDFGELGRIAEAKAACKLALEYPFASAYPEWTETRHELEAKHTSASSSVIAISHAPQPDSAPQAQPQSEHEPLKLIVFSFPAIIQDSFQISIFPFPATAMSASGAMSILDRVLICAGPRAPPTSI